MILAGLFSFLISFGPRWGKFDTLQVQTATGLTGNWTTKTVYSQPSPFLTLYSPPDTIIPGEDSTRVYLSLSGATDTKTVARARTGYHGQWTPWSPIAGIVTGARDTFFVMMTQDGRLVHGTWTQGISGVAKVGVDCPPISRMDSTIRMVSQREVQTFWYEKILSIFGYVR